MDGRLQPADRILSVAQGSAPFEDVVGWRLDEVVQKIRGPKGSQIRLEVQAGELPCRSRVDFSKGSCSPQSIYAAAPIGGDPPSFGSSRMPMAG